MSDYLNKKFKDFIDKYSFKLNDFSILYEKPEDESFFSVLLNKEILIIDEKRKTGEDLHKKLTTVRFQNESIKFCKDLYQLQEKKTVYDLDLDDQLKFTGCVNEVISGIVSDLTEIENNQNLCFKGCKNEYDTYLNLKFENMNPKINKLPCVSICTEIYKNLNKNYEKYMIDNKGIYIEFINIKKNI